jgi:hypothetical protein
MSVLPLNDNATARARPVVPPPGPALTWVDLVWFEERVEHWIRFGRIADEAILDRRRRRVAFADGVFAFVRWAANDVGTTLSRIDIIRTVEPGAACSSVPGVTPGGELLLRQSGWPRVQAVLAAIDAIEALGLDAADVAPDHWRQVHNRLSARQPAEPYSLLRHRAWRLRRSLSA